jgi:hypothetical protein
MLTLDIAHQSGPMIVTLIYLGLYYAFMTNVAVVKTSLTRKYQKRGEKFDRYFGEDRQMLAADRIQLNMLEHMGPFLALLWLNAIFIGPRGATIAGGIYVGARALYPLLMGKRLGRGIQAKILISTGAGYLVLVYLVGALVVGLL